MQCVELASNGECDQDCNSTQCLWDKGDCGDLMTHLLHTLGDTFTERSAARLELLTLPRHRHRHRPPIPTPTLYPYPYP